MNNVQKEKPAQINGESTPVLNGKADESLNCESTETDNEDKMITQPKGDDGSVPKRDPTDDTYSGVS